VLGCCGCVLIRAAPVVLIIFALLLPANAQFWGNSWGWRQQQPYNPYGGGFGGYRQWDYWGYRQAPSPRVRERGVEKGQPPDYSHAPPATPRKDATVKVVVMGDANADWLAYGLEDAFSEKAEIGIVRKHRTDSGLIRYDQRRDSEWPQVAREIIAAEKPKLMVMMIGNNDRQTIRDKAPPPAPASAQPIQQPPAVPPSRPDLERQPIEQKYPPLTPTQARQADYGPWEFRSEARPLRRARNRAHHRQQGHAGRASGAGRSGPASAECQSGRPGATAGNWAGRAAHGNARCARRTDGGPKRHSRP
jgi:hypothetical protein